MAFFENMDSKNIIFINNNLIRFTLIQKPELPDTLIQKWENEDECEVPPISCYEHSIACFQKPNLTFDYSDPYKNTFGEKNVSIIISVIVFVALFVIGMILMVGIICFERFALRNQRRLLLDMVSCTN